MAADSPREHVASMISGYWISQTVYVVAKLGIADLLVERSPGRRRAGPGDGKLMPARSIASSAPSRASGCFAKKKEGASP